MKRKGDWRDVLSSYTYAVDGKKLYLGFTGIFLNVLLFIILVSIYRTQLAVRVDAQGEFATDYLGPWFQGILAPSEGLSLAGLFSIDGKAGILASIVHLYNPFGGGLGHFAFSLLAWLGALWIDSGRGGAIARLTALEYARDELPTIGDGTGMVKARRLEFFLTPVTPLVGIVFMWLCLLLGGLIASIPYVGPILMIPGYLLCILAAMVMTFLIVIGLLCCGLMMPAMAVTGKGAFDSWTSAYTYVLWAFGRFIGYCVTSAAVGIVSFAAALGVTMLLLGTMHASINMGTPGERDWLGFENGDGWALRMPAPEPVVRSPETPSGTGAADEPAVASNTIGSAESKADGEGGSRAFAATIRPIVYLFYLLVLIIPFGYAYAYYFASHTIMYLLLRKHVDNVDLDEVCDVSAEPVAAAAEDAAGSAETEPATDAATEETADEDVIGPAEAALEEEPEEPEEPEEDISQVQASEEPEEIPEDDSGEDTEAEKPKD